ncbi:MAG: 50S ribosomal protein L23 [Thermodesulfobacteriota bacterium]|nr:50S ribosomal protein L23 [Thermodesulfobacteriota bacterium]
MTPYEILKRPVITEKSTIQKETNNQLTFEVARRANKVEIRRAVEQVFNAKVVSVRTIQMKGKVKRFGRTLGKRRNWKKAIVTLAAGARVDFFEGV